MITQEPNEETGDEILGQTLTAEWKMRAIKKVNALFGKGAPAQDLNLLRVLHAGILSIERISPEEGVVISVGADDTVQFKAPAPEQTSTKSGGLTATVTKKAYNIGDTLPDGWVVGPRSPKTGIVMALEPVSGALDGYKTWYQGEDHAKELREQGHINARQPSADNNNDELNAIYNEIVEAGQNDNAELNTSASFPLGKYWSGTVVLDFRNFAQLQDFYTSDRRIEYRDRPQARVRCVRDEPGLTLK